MAMKKKIADSHSKMIGEIIHMDKLYKQYSGVIDWISSFTFNEDKEAAKLNKMLAGGEFKSLEEIENYLYDELRSLTFQAEQLRRKL